MKSTLNLFVCALGLILVISLLSGCASDSSKSFTDGDGDKGDNESCQKGHTACEENVISICLNGALQPIADCAVNGWICEAGACAAAGSETETERNYRVRLNELRLANAGRKIKLDEFGGLADAEELFGKPEPAEFFKIKKINGRWWFITPKGNPFFSKGVTDVVFEGANPSDENLRKIISDIYGDEKTWGDAAEKRLKNWNFNTIGPWSGSSMGKRFSHTAVILDSAGHAPRYTSKTIAADYWSEGFEDWTRKTAIERAAPYLNERNLIGYFLDNELFWGNDWRSEKTLLQVYIDFPADAPGKKEALRFVKEKASDINDFNLVWGTSIASWDELDSLGSGSFKPNSDVAKSVSEAFSALAFNKYAALAVAGLRSVDANHLVLGCRFAFYPGDALMREAAKAFDVISMAGYHENWVDELDSIWPEIDKPIIIEEFSFKAKDSGLRNIMNYAIVVETQKDRALAYDDYVKSFASRPYAVALHWYKWFDNPSDGFLAGDNFGLLNFEDVPYSDFTEFIRETNFQIENWHAGVDLNNN